MQSHHAGVVYTRQLLAKIAEQCLIDLIYFYYKGDAEYIPCENVNVIRKIEINRHYKVYGALSLFWLFPQFTARFNWKVCRYIQSRVSKKDYDFVYFDFSQTFAYSLFIKHPHKILMAHDVMAQKYSRMRTYLRPWAVVSENKILKQGAAVFTFSEKDCNLIKEMYGIASLSTTFFLCQDVQAAVPDAVGDYFVFFGGWSREENHEALEWFVDNVNPQIPHYKYKIIGGGLPLRIKNKLPENFEYLGFVDNPYPIIANAKAEIAPLRKGAGVKVKCIDALGCGTPVIGTDVAFEGIPLVFDEFLFHAETVSDYVKIITEFGISKESRIRFKHFFSEKYNNKAVLNYIIGK